MELMLQTNPLCYLKTRRPGGPLSGETGETLVPDGEPDIATLADCAAEVYLRGKDLREGTVTVAGGVKGTVLYLPEDGTTVRCLECYLPFTIKVEHPALTDRSDVCCELRVRSVDARILNARKALLRVNLACAVTAYQAAAETFASMESAIPRGGDPRDRDPDGAAPGNGGAGVCPQRRPGAAGGTAAHRDPLPQPLRPAGDRSKDCRGQGPVQGDADLQGPLPCAGWEPAAREPGAAVLPVLHSGPGNTTRRP